MLMGRSRRAVWTAAARALEDNGFSALSWVLLACLIKHGPAPQGEIASAIGQHPAGVSRLLDDMEAEGLVRRRRDADDRRRARVALTARGRARFKAGEPHVLGALRETLSPLSAAELRQLHGLLQKLAPPAAPATRAR
jgi:MarR family 2-MHQ and catechol resistance regulon transcriptional repressor